MRRFLDQDGKGTFPGGLQSRYRAAGRPPAQPNAIPASPSGSVARVLDVVIAGTALIVLSPLMAVIAVLIRLTSSGPAIFRQLRLGYLEQPFVLLKFRTMHIDCDDRVHREYVTSMLTQGQPRSDDGVFKLAGDLRITRLGAFLRRTSLDELPQLINVLQGEMSLVGPRPALPWEVALYQDPRYRMRFQVKPGITGLWQVRGRNRLSMNQALELDVEYTMRRSLSLYLWILVMTVPAVLGGGGAR
jgi:lipopolysaccharide/colanic/teichoic acid biosynthesis glycosyltransferase